VISDVLNLEEGRERSSVVVGIFKDGLLVLGADVGMSVVVGTTGDVSMGMDP
jgi:hypothetical protein